MLELVIDNDVLLKFCEYRMLDELGHFGCQSGCSNDSGALGTAIFVGRNRLKKKITAGQLDAAVLDELAGFLDSLHTLEPTGEEVRAAACLEEWGLLNGFQLHTGESQLLAIASIRGAHFLSGDRRAIVAAERAASVQGWLLELANRVWCLEQAIGAVVRRRSALTVRKLICASPTSDVAMRICFECSSPSRDDFAPTGLSSYIENLRRGAPKLLGAGSEVALPA